MVPPATTAPATIVTESGPLPELVVGGDTRDVEVIALAGESCAAAVLVASFGVAVVVAAGLVADLVVGGACDDCVAVDVAGVDADVAGMSASSGLSLSAGF